MPRNKSIIEKELRDLTDVPLAEWVILDFNTIVEARGFDVYHERALKCPCKIKGGENITGCSNCLGSGWVFLNKNKTRMVLQSMNSETKFKEWSEEKLGTVSLTAKFVDRISFMDRITVINSQAVFNQVLYPVDFKKQLFAYTIYDITEVSDLFIYDGEDRPLKRLVLNTDYTFADNKVLFDKKYKERTSLTASIIYIHPLQFHVIDITKDVRNTFLRQDDGTFESTNFPVFAVARKSHYVLDSENYSGTLVEDNSE